MSRRGTVTRAAPWVLLAAGVLVVAVAGGDRDTEGPPLDPRSTDELGTRALVVLLEESGARVDITAAPPADARAALLLQDDLEGPRLASVRRWVRQGGVLVVADPLSVFAPAIEEPVARPFEFGEPTGKLARECDLPALREVDRVEPSGGVTYALPVEQGQPVAGAVGCFPAGDGFFVVARPLGEGTVVAIGGAGAFVNSVIGEGDNAALAVSLLAPTTGATIAFLEPPGPGGGRATLTDLIPDSVKHAIWQLAIAFGVYALWRGRRLGRPVEEQQPVVIPGSELVVAVGHLLQQARRRDQAAAMLRLDLVRSLSERLGVPADAPPEVVAAAVAAATGGRAEDVAAALAAPPPSSEDALVGLARTMESIREEVVHAR